MSNKPKNRPSFRIILSHLEIAGVELANCNETYSEQQKSWQKEVREQMQSSINNGTKIHEHEQDLIRKRQEEWKHAKDVRAIYERKLQRTNDLYNELSSCFAQLEEREREIAEREKQIGTSKPYRKAIPQLRKQHFDKISRRRLYMAAQIAAQANAVNTANSPSPPGSPMKTSMYVQLDGNSTKSVIQTPIGYSTKYNPKKSRHRRVGSGSSMKNIIKKQFETTVVDTQTQTEDLEKVEEDATSASSSKTNSTVVKRNQNSDDDSSSGSDIDDNVPQEDTTSSSMNTNNQAMANSMATSIMTGSNLSYDTEDQCDKNRVASDDDNLESLRRKVNELIIETTSTIDSYSTNSSATTIINKNFAKRQSRNCDSCIDHATPADDTVDNNKNIKSVKCSCADDDDVDEKCNGSVDDDANSCSDDDFGAPKKFNYSLRMKR